MVEKLVSKLIVRHYEEDVVDYIFRKQDMRNRITDFISGLMATIALGAMIMGLVWAYLTAPVDEYPVSSGHSDPEAVIEWSFPWED